MQFEAAGALVSLTSAPTAVKAAAATFIQLLCNVSPSFSNDAGKLNKPVLKLPYLNEQEADNNVKLIVSDKLDSIRQKYIIAPG